jgi:hypothetical protein
MGVVYLLVVVVVVIVINDNGNNKMENDKRHFRNGDPSPYPLPQGARERGKRHLGILRILAE